MSRGAWVVVVVERRAVLNQHMQKGVLLTDFLPLLLEIQLRRNAGVYKCLVLIVSATAVVPAVITAIMVPWAAIITWSTVITAILRGREKERPQSPW